MKHSMKIFTALTTVLLLGSPAVGAADDDTRAERRHAIDQMASEALEQLFQESKGSKAVFDRAVGYAVFSNYKFQFIFSGGGGRGVAVHKEAGERTYMKMATGGVGLGLGGKKYTVVFLFEDSAALERFVEEGWQADTQAGVAAGKASADVESSFHDGLSYYQLTEKGLVASADVSGTRYWKNDELNQ